MSCLYCAGELRTAVSNWFCVGDLGGMILQYHSAKEISVLNISVT